MTLFISLLRGINVGGRNKLPMASLRDLLSGMGYADVQTYIQSGNCLFRSAEDDPDVISQNIAEAIEANFGFRPHILTLTQAKLDAVIAANPYGAAAEADPKTVHVYFMSAAPTAPDITALDAIKTSKERFELNGPAFYLYAPDGIGRSKLAARAEAKLGVPATARNYRTVLKLRDLSQQGSQSPT